MHKIEKSICTPQHLGLIQNKLTRKSTYYENEEKNSIRRSQRDYSLAIKLNVVIQLEKGIFIQRLREKGIISLLKA